MSLWSSPNSRGILCQLRGMKLLIPLVLVAGSTAIATMESIKKVTNYQLGTATGAGAASQQDKSEANTHASPSPVITDEIKIVDSQGHPRITISAKSGNPVPRLLQTNGAASVEVLLDSTGHPAVTLANPDLKGPTAALAVDDKEDACEVRSSRRGIELSFSQQCRRIRVGIHRREWRATSKRARRT
jgi:hypothetical protein